MDAPRNLMEAIRRATQERPDKRALTFMDDGDTESRALSFGELDRLARSLAARLQADGLEGERAMLLFEPGLDFIVSFVACLYAGVVPVPAYPPEPHRLAHTLARLERIVADAQARVVLTSPLIRGFAEGVMAQAQGDALSRLAWISSDESAASPDDWRPPTLDDGTLAFLQYSSGSTSDPKGVLITHGSIWSNIQMCQRAFELSAESVFVSWLPVYHDMGLIGTLLSPLATGAEVWLMPPHAFLKKPVRWVDLMSRARATVTAAPNFAFDLVVRKTSLEARARLDLSSLRVVANGAEPVRRDSVERFVRYFSPAGLGRDVVVPSYGMAEVGLFASCAPSGRRFSHLTVSKSALARHKVTGALPGDADAVAFVSCGVPDGDGRVEIVHPETRRRLGPGAVGEVWLAGPHVAAGYWRQPELTEVAFGARLADEPERGPFLRTGDLGFVQDGDLFITGRRKDLLIIRGRNLYPQDLERSMDATASVLPEVRPGCAAAVSIELDGEEALAIFQEVDPRLNPEHDPARVASTLRDAVARDHDVQAQLVVLVARGTLPKTSSGKVMRFACRQAALRDFAEGGLEVVYRDTLTQASPPPRVSAEASAAAVEPRLAWLRAQGLRALDDAGLSPHFVLELGNQGLLGLEVPREQGGLGLTADDAARVVQQAAAIDLGLAMFLATHNALGAGPLRAHGHDAQQAELLPALASGRALATLAATDDDDPLEAPRLEGAEGAWRLNGELRSVPGARPCAALNVLARHGDGFTLLHLPRSREGCGVHAEASEASARGVPPARVRFEDVAVRAHDVLGAPGEGLAAAGASLDHARFLLAAAGLGAAQRALQLMLRFASRRPIAAGWLLDHPTAVDAVHQTVLEVTALDASVTSLAARIDAGVAVPSAAFAALKVRAAETALHAADRLAELLGARGRLERNLAPQLQRDARQLGVLHGSRVALLAQVGAALGADPGPAVAFLAEALGASEVAERVRSALAAVPAGGRPASRAWPDFRAGELYAAALGQAALAGASDPRRRMAAEAIGAEVARRADALAPEALRARGPSARALTQLAQESIAGIGELGLPRVDPAAAGDPLLEVADAARAAARPEAPKALVPEKAPAPARPKGPDDEVAQLKRWMISWIARELGVSPQTLQSRIGFKGSASTPFSALGIDSVTTVQFVGALEEKLGSAIPVTTLREHGDVDSLARHLIQQRRR